MLKDAFANYVLQQMIEAADDAQVTIQDPLAQFTIAQRKALLARIRPHAALLRCTPASPAFALSQHRGYSYGKHIQAKLDKFGA